MIQRFQVLVYPDISSDWKYIDKSPNLVVQQRVQGIFNQVLKHEPQEPLRYRFCSDGQAVFVRWLEQLETRIRTNGLDPSLSGHLGKYRGLMPSLALIFEITQRATDGSVGFVGPKVGAPLTVSLEHALLAIRWCEYLESHARRVYSIFSTEMYAAQKLV